MPKGTKKRDKAVVMMALPPQPRPSKTKWYVAAAIGCVLITATVLLIIAHRQSRPSPSPTLSTNQQYSEGKQVADNFRNGEGDDAIKQLDQILSQRLTNEQRIGFLEQKAGELVRQGKPDQALAVYKQSEALQTGKPYLTIPTANGLMAIYADKGDKQQALAYGHKLVEAARASKEPAVHSNLAGYESLVKAMEEDRL